jgi:hypothetical protein
MIHQKINGPTSALKHSHTVYRVKRMYYIGTDLPICDLKHNIRYAQDSLLNEDLKYKDILIQKTRISVLQQSINKKRYWNKVQYLDKIKT